MNSKMEWRHVRVYTLPLELELSLLRPEQAILRFPNDTTLDVGALCYLQRITPTIPENATKSHKGRKVAIGSLCQKRVSEVRAFIQYISDEVRSGYRRVETIRNSLSRFMSFMAWADENGRHNMLSNGPSLLADLRAYLHFVRDRVARNEISLNSGAILQRGVVSVLENFLQFDDLGRGMHLLTVDTSSKQSTSPPSEEAQGKVLSLCSCIFQTLSSIAIDNLPYPHAMPMPEYLRFPQNRLWVFPGTCWFKTPAMLTVTQQWGACYNYSEGRVATFSEVSATGGLTRPRQRVQGARLRLAAANSDAQHPGRRQAAITAMAAYLIMFVAETGMNWAQVMDLTWADDYTVEATHQSFRTVKWRAGGKALTFELPIGALPTFRRFLDLRRYILQGQQLEYLFFSMSAAKVGSAKRLSLHLSSTYHMLRRIDPGLPKVMPRAWRAAKSNWLVRNTDVATAALVLQNTERTVLRSYAEGSETDHVEEMGAFLGQLSSAVLSPRHTLEAKTTRAVGKCTSFGEPRLRVSSSVTPPNCRDVEGCLHCDKFRMHADDRDARKLLSCRHMLRRTASLLGHVENQSNVMGPHLKRIEELLAELIEHDAAMVARIEREVDEEGELDQYWAGKLEMLLELGVIT